MLEIINDTHNFCDQADTGCWMSHDGDDDFAASCDCCGEPCHPSKLTDTGVCRSCCPLRLATLRQELAADLAWEEDSVRDILWGNDGVEEPRECEGDQADQVGPQETCKPLESC